MKETDKGIQKENGFGKIAEIAAIAYRAAYWFLLAATLICVLWTAAFPYAAMKFYAKTGNLRAASERANHIISRQVRQEKEVQTGVVSYSFKKERPDADSQFTDALYYYALKNSQTFVREGIVQKGYEHPSVIRDAKKAVRLGEIYRLFNSQAANRAWEAGAMTGMIADAHPDLFRFEALAATDYMRALYIAEPSRIPGEIAKLSYDLHGIDPASANSGISETMMDSLALSFASLNAVMNLELDIIGYQGDGKGGVNTAQITRDQVQAKEYFRYLYSRKVFEEYGVIYVAGKQGILNLLEQKLPYIKDYIDHGFQPQNDTEKLLKRAYWARQLSQLTMNIRVVTEIVHIGSGSEETVGWATTNGMQTEWAETHDRYEWEQPSSGVPTVKGFLFEWYRERILNQYVDSVKANG